MADPSIVSEKGDSVWQPASTATPGAGPHAMLSLTTEVPRNLLRGVQLHKVFSRFGHVWGTSAGDADTYAMSEMVDRIDNFISHDWRTPRWKKLITLCFVYNTMQAILASVVASSVVSILLLKFNVTALSFADRKQNGGVMADFQGSYIPIIVGCVTFFLFFLFWQQMRACLPGTPGRVFVDKVCINQTDEEAKNAGILGLGGFISHSDSILILWSPRYFRRLWCVYEVATWLHIHAGDTDAGHGNITLMPVGFIVGALSYMMSVLIFRVISLAVPISWISIVAFVILAGLGPCLAVMTIDSERRLVEEQVSSFSAAESGCYCCQVGHADPETGAPMICDRKLVYEKLGEWFPEGVPDACTTTALAATLEKFNTKVQCEWGPEVSQRLRSPGFIYQIGFFTTVPLLWEMSAKFDALRQFGPAHGASYVYYYLQFPFIVCPLILKGAFLVNQVCVTLFPRPPTRAALLARHALVVACVIIEMAAIALPAVTISGSLQAQIAMYAIYLAVALPVFLGHRFARWIRRLVRGPPAAKKSFEPVELQTSPRTFEAAL